MTGHALKSTPFPNGPQPVCTGTRELLVSGLLLVCNLYFLSQLRMKPVTVRVELCSQGRGDTMAPS